MDCREYAKKICEIVCRRKNNVWERKYYRFRVTHFYGGCVTADAVGCNLNCAFCWVGFPRTHPHKAGRFYAPEEVVKKLLTLVEKSGIDTVRISGCEPTLCKDHLLQVLELLEDKDLFFILETNGTLIDDEYAKDLSPFKHFIHVRVSLKGFNDEDFQKITGFCCFRYQLEALQNLVKYHIPCHAAVIADFATEEKMKKLIEKLREIHPKLVSIELEKLVFYPGVKERMEKAGLL